MVEEESILNIERDKLTPGMQQYQDAKKENPDCVIMLRMGDFYELFYEDAVTASRELEITLTARGKHEKRAPLAGIPYHALEGYLGRLVKKGYKVAIVEQLEDPKKAKGLVKRGCVRIVTPGTVIESSMLDEKENNYLMGLSVVDSKYSIALADLSTGEFFTFITNDVLGDIARFSPKECVIPASLMVDVELVNNVKNFGCFVNTMDDYFFRLEKSQNLLENHFSSFSSFGLANENIMVAGGLLKYLLDTQKNSLQHIKNISVRGSSSNMVLDSSTFRNLELIKNLRDGSSRGTLLGVLDKTVTAMGGRLLKRWLKSPLLEVNLIEKRLQALEELNGSIIVREELISLLKQVYDLERLIGRISYGNASPRDLLALGNSLSLIPAIKEKLFNFTGLLCSISMMDELSSVVSLINNSIKEDAAIIIRDGGVIKPNYNPELSSLWEISLNAKKYISQVEERERVKTGIGSLKIGFNKVFGYYIEVTRKNVGSVPANYIRKQTTANSERYITEELKIEEEKIFGAHEKIKTLEYEIFQSVLKEVGSHVVEIQDVAGKIAVLDVLCSLALVSSENRYVKPGFVNNSSIMIKDGRHPVVERMGSFVPNDVILSEGEMMIITGPNMAGKSTCMRQVALITLMAQIGCFVPATSCVLGIVDRIFTRVGASDDISSGQSTFMVEMTETAQILNNATSSSLIIMDEI